MSVEELMLHFLYADDEAMSDSSGRGSPWGRQYYIPGDIMKGVVSLHVRSRVKVRAVTLFLLGTATVSWEAPSKKKVYQSSEIYLESSKPLLDPGYDQMVPLGQGLHQFSFKYQLPTDLPSTFNGVYGQVTYLAKVLLDCEDERNTTITSEPFMVLRRPELPDSAYLEKTIKKKRFFVGFTSGRVRVVCTIDKTAAVPGDDLLVDAEITNWTGRQINLIQASLIQESSYLAQGHQLLFRQYLSKRDDVYDVTFEQGRRWRKVHLPVPPFLPDSGLDKCTIMEVKYIFQFKVSIEGKDDIVVETPLLVGGHHPVHGPAGKESFLLNRMWNNMAIADEAPNYRPRDGNRSNYTESINGDFPDNRFYRNITEPGRLSQHY
ncbi:arrestin domain-containing protein 4-like [Plakobranchus ocellatus]|uniref:Arrestin domain-containing protein 4-like n=1 Tax=Plakobranchus ocellatus TaxID=259542 RepID=A0AAV4B8S9_9GAST|nr:arrestin domain-containing protein 4-like [Plakobranchus ocellatus]